jgi:hypothetical protein
MKIVVTTKKILRTVKHGVLPRGIPVEIDDSLAKFYISRGDAMRYETKEAIDRPLEAVGQDVQSSALPAAPVLPEQTLSESEVGVKKRGRKKRSLLPTPASE